MINILARVLKVLIIVKTYRAVMAFAAGFFYNPFHYVRILRRIEKGVHNLAVTIEEDKLNPEAAVDFAVNTSIKGIEKYHEVHKKRNYARDHWDDLTPEEQHEFECDTKKYRRMGNEALGIGVGASTVLWAIAHII